MARGTLLDRLNGNTSPQSSQSKGGRRDVYLPASSHLLVYWSMFALQSVSSPTLLSGMATPLQEATEKDRLMSHGEAFHLKSEVVGRVKSSVGPAGLDLVFGRTVAGATEDVSKPSPQPG